MVKQTTPGWSGKWIFIGISEFKIKLHIRLLPVLCGHILTIRRRSVGAGIPPSPAGTWGLELGEAKELACGQMALRSGRFSKCVESQSFFSI